MRPLTVDQALDALRTALEAEARESIAHRLRTVIGDGPYVQNAVIRGNVVVNDEEFDKSAFFAALEAGRKNGKDKAPTYRGVRLKYVPKLDTASLYPKPKRRMSPAGRALIAAAARKRWREYNKRKAGKK